MRLGFIWIALFLSLQILDPTSRRAQALLFDNYHQWWQCIRKGILNLPRAHLPYHFSATQRDHAHGFMSKMLSGLWDMMPNTMEVGWWTPMLEHFTPSESLMLCTLAWGTHTSMPQNFDACDDRDLHSALSHSVLPVSELFGPPDVCNVRSWSLRLGQHLSLALPDLVSTLAYVKVD